MAQHTCPNCAFSSPEGFRFCGQCGTRLSAEAGELTVEPTAVYKPRVERRQLTVLFCDLVGSTELSQSLDPEDLRKVIRTYQSTCEPVIEQFGGHVSRFLGDGILTFFGYPQAREDDAKQAVHAGLGIIDAINSVDWTLRFGLPLNIAVRVGISTGIVVAGDLIGKGAAEEEAVVGETPNLAARLQSLARPNTVLIASRTRRLVEEQFVLTSLGKHELKGFSKALDVWRAESAINRPTRFEAKWVAGITPLANRHAEMKFLTERWELSKRGQCQLVMICGEAGIGKSRLTEALRDYAAHESHHYMQYQCSPYHANTALYPITMQYERAALIGSNDSNVVKRERIRELIISAGMEQKHILPAMSALLSIPNAPDDEFEQLRAVEKKTAIIAALFEQLVSLSRSKPLLAIMEDVHWIDPTSRELIELFSKELNDTRIMIVLTCLTGSTCAGKDFSRAEEIQLPSLESNHSMELIRSVASGTTLPSGMVERIADKADGIPLFAEELTKSLLTNAQQNQTAVVNAIDTPDTLQDLLMARLDQLGPGKRVSQIAAVIGRQFSYKLVERIADVSETELHDGFDRLLSSGLVTTEGYLPEITCSFRHALLRDTAYGSLLREEREIFHERIAAVLEAGKMPPAPELLAQHYTEAKLHRQAIDYWLLAGQAASQRSALHEAASQFQSGLALVRIQTPGQQRDRKLLEYLTNLGPVLIATQGSGTAETEAVYQEAIALTESLPVSEDHFAALWGWWRISNNFQTDAQRASKLQELADKLDDDGLKLQAHHCQWATRFHLGDHSGCLQHTHEGITLYADRDYRSHAARYGGHDPRVCALGEAAQSLWLTGFPDEAEATMRRARLWADELKQSGSLVHVMDMNLLLLRYQCNPESAAKQAAELIKFAEENQFPEYLAKANAFKGWSQVKAGNSAEGIKAMQESIALYDTIGTDEDPPVWFEMLADACIDTGEFQSGLNAIDQAFRHTEQSGLRFWDAELHRRRGELLYRLRPDNTADAIEHFEKAIDVSIEQGAKSLQLRATMSLIHCSKGHDSHKPAQQRLADILDQFDEGFNTPDLIAARALVERLAVT
ncbi:MAG: adenylate/guanylate cyclase domain-containing protein [Granulosicoccus sp.]